MYFKMSPPPLTPGCLVLWMDNSDKFHYNLVIQFTDDVKQGFYNVMMIKDMRIINVSLTHKDMNVRWRVLHSAL